MKTTSVTLLTILIFSFTNAQDSKQVKIMDRLLKRNG